MRFGISNRNFWEGEGDPVRHGLEGANRPKASPGSCLPVGVIKNLDRFVKLEPSLM